MVHDVGTAAVALLRQADVALDDGLTEEELGAVERRFDFEFGCDHAALLQIAMPVSDGWPDWRRDADSDLSTRLAWPVDGVVFDVLHNHFWPASWGIRPSSDQGAERLARAYLQQWPKLVPLYRHRYMVAAPSPSEAPVFSVSQTDVLHYGADLLDYLRREWHLTPLPREHMQVCHPVSPWSDLAVAAENADL